MKILKRIILADEIDGNEMNLLRGGIQARANINKASDCTCTGSSNGTAWCNNNTNSSTPCRCSGNGSNTNSAPFCQCSGDNTNNNGYTSCQCS